MAEPVTFLASFPSIQTAIKVTGNGDGMRIQLDIPESEMAQAVKLLLMREQPLTVTIEIANLKSKLDQDGKLNRNGRLQKGTKRQSEWTPAEG
jgi:hypothetical protein